jgi:glycine cleavage system H lipoate-binding protein
MLVGYIHFLTNKNTTTMKTTHAIYKVLALLIIATALAHASPNGEAPSSQHPSRVISEPGLETLSAKLVSGFNLANRETPVTFSGAYDTEFAIEFSQGGAIALVTRRGYSGLDDTESWMMSIGREVMIPVMNENHPLRTRIEQQGISPGEFAAMLKGKEPLYVGNEPGAASYVAEFMGVGMKDIPESMLKPENELMELIRTNPAIMGFIRLTSVIDPENQRFLKGISPVPIDVNGNGILDHPENIYRSAGELIHGITIGKYPRSLYSRVYAITPGKPVEKGDLAFLKWLLQDGQEYLELSGLVALQPYEKRSVYKHLMEEPVPAVEIQLEKSANRTIFLIVGLLILIPLIFLFIVAWITRHSRETGTIQHPRPAFGTESLSFPGGLFFDQSHTWTFMEKEGLVRIGLDDFLLHVTGKVTGVEMKRPGEKIEKGELMMKIIQQGKKLEIRSPLSGVVVHQNENLESNVPCINESPYSEGWVYLVEPQNWLAEIKGYLMGENYRQWIKNEFVRLKDFFSKGIALVAGGVPSPVIQDGGEIHDGLLETFGPEVWEEFQTRFMNQPDNRHSN